MSEIWKWISGFEGLYKISNKGRVKSFHRKKKKGKILSANNKSGYKKINLSKNGKCYSIRIHRLVAEAFIPNPENKSQINHLDMNKSNNKVENLEWVTPAENVRHAVKNKPEMIESLINYNKYEKPRTVQQLTMDGEVVAEYCNAQEAARETDVCGRSILMVANKKEYSPGKHRKQAGGFIWKFKNESRDQVARY